MPAPLPNAYDAAAELLVVFCLRGRAMETTLFRAVVAETRQRLLRGEAPVLDAGLRQRIDALAGTGALCDSPPMQVDSVACWRSHA